MSTRKSFRILEFSVPLAGIIFLFLGITYFICLIAVAACEEGTGECNRNAEIIFRVITAPTYFLSELSGWFPFFLIHLVALIIDAVVFAMLVYVINWLLNRRSQGSGSREADGD